MATGAENAPAGLVERLRAKLGGGGGHALAALAVRLLAAGLAYLLQIVLARALGSADYGLFSLAWNILTIGGFLATFGFSELAVRFLAQYHERADFARASGFLRAGVLVTLVGTLLAAGVGYLLAPALGHAYAPLAGDLLRAGLIALPFFALTDFFEGVARSQGWTIRALVPPYVLRQGALILGVLALLVLAPPVTPTATMLAAAFASALAAGMQVALLSPLIATTLPATKPVYETALWRAAAGPTVLSELAMLARQHIDLLVLGLFVGPAEVGLYFAATRIASLLGLIEFAIKAGMGHRFARAAQSEDRAALGAVWHEARRMGLGPGMAAALALALFSPLVLWLFGPAFMAAAPVAAILVAATAAKLALGPCDEALAMSGHPGLVWRANALAAVVTGLGTAGLAPIWGMTGAALATLAGALSGAGLMLHYLRRYLGIHPFTQAAPTGGSALPEGLTTRLEPLEAFAAQHRGAWEALETGALEPNPFYAPDFLLAGARHLERAGAITALSVWRGPTLVGLLPLHAPPLRAGLPLGVLAAYSNAYTCLTNPLVSPADPRATLEAMFAALDSCGKSALSLPLLPAERPLTQELAGLPRASSLMSRHARAALAPPAGSTPQAYIDREKRAARKTINRRARRLEAAGLVRHVVTRGPQAPLEGFLTLEAAGWKGHRGTALGARPRTRAFARAAFGPTSTQKFEIETLFQGETPVAMSLNLVAGGVVHTFKQAYDERFRAFGPGKLLDRAAIARAHGPEAPRFDSCALPGCPAEDIWHERAQIAHVLVALGTARGPESLARRVAFARAVQRVLARLKRWRARSA